MLEYNVAETYYIKFDPHVREYIKYMYMMKLRKSTHCDAKQLNSFISEPWFI